MKTFAIAVLVFGILPFAGNVQAAGGGDYPHSPGVNMQDRASLQRGAALFVDNCMGCHSLEYKRYGRVGEDLGIPEDLVLEHLNFTTEEIGSRMEIGFPEDDAQDFFGVAPPDLTNVTRWESPDYVYSFLLGFYEDESRPFGYNNEVFDNVGMPHVMERMERELDEEEFRQAMFDITNFLYYVGDPVKLERERMGAYVLFFLALLFIPAYLLKKEYWKDVH